MKKLISSIQLIRITVSLGLLSGCAARPLAPDGAYQNPVLYEMDNSITRTHEALQEFVNWEAEYRTTLAQWPEIRKIADTIVNEGPGYFQSANALRDVYAANPTGENKDKFDAALSILKQLSREAAKHLGAKKSVTTKKVSQAPLFHVPVPLEAGA